MLAGLLLAIATCLSLANYSALTGTDSVLVNNLPFLFLVVVIAGYLHGSWLKRNRPSVYLKVGSTRVEEEVLVPAAA